MSHTVIVDDRERSRQFENQINKAVRHCKVRVKRWKHPYEIRPITPVQPFPPLYPSPLDGWGPAPAKDPLYPIQWWQNPVVSTC